jgi:magnesium transporter
MPETKSPWGYPLSLIGMLAICITLYRYFRRAKWL